MDTRQDTATWFDRILHQMIIPLIDPANLEITLKSLDFIFTSRLKNDAFITASMSQEIEQSIKHNLFNPQKNVLYVKGNTQYFSYFAEGMKGIEELTAKEMGPVNTSSFASVELYRNEILEIAETRKHIKHDQFDLIEMTKTTKNKIANQNYAFDELYIKPNKKYLSYFTKGMDCIHQIDTKDISKVNTSKFESIKKHKEKIFDILLIRKHIKHRHPDLVLMTKEIEAQITSLNDPLYISPNKGYLTYFVEGMKQAEIIKAEDLGPIKMSKADDLAPIKNDILEITSMRGHTKSDLDIGVKLHILHQLHLRLSLINKNEFLDLQQLQHILIGCIIVASKLDCDLAIWNEDFYDLIPLTTTVNLNQIEADHLHDCNYDIYLTGEKLTPILKKFCDIAMLEQIQSEIQSVNSADSSINKYTDVDDGIVTLLNRQTVVSTNVIVSPMQSASPQEEIKEVIDSFINNYNDITTPLNTHTELSTNVVLNQIQNTSSSQEAENNTTQSMPFPSQSRSEIWNVSLGIYLFFKDFIRNENNFSSTFFMNFSFNRYPTMETISGIFGFFHRHMNNFTQIHPSDDNDIPHTNTFS